MNKIEEWTDKSGTPHRVYTPEGQNDVYVSAIYRDFGWNLGMGWETMVFDKSKPRQVLGQYGGDMVNAFVGMTAVEVASKAKRDMRRLAIL